TETRVAISFYGTTNLRAAAAGTDDALNDSVNYAKDFDLSSVAKINLDASNDAAGIDSLMYRPSVTYFTGDKGFEISDYTINYKKGRKSVAEVSILFYGTTNLRAETAGTDDALNASVNYAKDFDL